MNADLALDIPTGDSEAIPTFPGVPLIEVVRFLEPSETEDYLSVIRSFRTWVQTQLKKP